AGLVGVQLSFEDPGRVLLTRHRGTFERDGGYAIPWHVRVAGPRPVPHPHRVLEPHRPGTSTRVDCRPTDRLVVGMPVAGPRRRAPRAVGDGIEQLGQE